MGKRGGKRSTVRLRRRREDNNKMDVQEMLVRWWRRGVETYCSGQGQVAGSCTRRNEPSGSKKMHGIS